MSWNMSRNTEKRAYWEKHTVGPGIWREHGKNEENETQTLFKLNWQDTLKNGENEKCTL